MYLLAALTMSSPLTPFALGDVAGGVVPVAEVDDAAVAPSVAAAPSTAENADADAVVDAVV